MKKYHARSTPLPTLVGWLYQTRGLSGYVPPPYQNSHQLMVADIRFPDNNSTPAVVPACLYRLIHGKTFPEPLSVQSDMDVSLEVDNRLLRYYPMLKGILLSECM